MALLNPETLRAQFEAFSKLPVLRQVGLMVGLAASVAIGTAIVLWSQQPNYGLLFGGLSSKDAGQVTAALQRASIPYRVDPNSGAIMVPSTQVYNARIKLATEGLPKGTASSFDLLAKNQGAFGLSQFMETVQYHQALQKELERTIASVDSVQSDRVHLAIPKQSVFIQDSPKPSASVLVNLYSGRTLSAAQVAGIVHLVGSSVPGLSTQNVTVVDQQGNLLTGNNGTAAEQSGSSLSSAQYDLTRRLDHLYARRISDILAPIVGSNGVRAQVTTSLDYSLINTTSEKYDPNSKVVRSEQSSDNRQWGKAANGAVPGALTNQPPPAGVPAGQSANNANAANNNPNATQNNPNQPPLVQENKSATRNYEINRTIQHIKQAPGVVKRLSVAVVVDYQTSKNAQGKEVSKALSPKEMTNITKLVKEAVGFNAARGDTVNVINAPFKQKASVPATGSPPIWQQPWVLELGKQVLGALAVLLLIFGVLRPVMRSLVSGSKPGQGEGEVAMDMAAGEGGGLGEDRVSLTPQAAGGAPLDGYDAHLANARQVAQADPKRVAQVVKSWVNEE
ncbi:MAG: flagellar basal-body MS-ring/collar protein FliF [Acidihalobacter sp.]